MNLRARVERLRRQMPRAGEVYDKVLLWTRTSGMGDHWTSPDYPGQAFKEADIPLPPDRGRGEVRAILVGMPEEFEQPPIPRRAHKPTRLHLEEQPIGGTAHANHGV